MKKLVKNPKLSNGRSDKWKICKKAHVSHRDMSIIKRKVRRNPFKTNKKSLWKRWRSWCAQINSMPHRAKRCKMWETGGSHSINLKDIHVKKRIEWARYCIKANFQSVFFTDECRSTLDESEGGAENGTVMLIHVPTGSGVNKKEAVKCFGVLLLVMS